MRTITTERTTITTVASDVCITAAHSIGPTSGWVGMDVVTHGDDPDTVSSTMGADTAERLGQALINAARTARASR